MVEQVQRGVVKGQKLFRTTEKQEIVESYDSIYSEMTLIKNNINLLFYMGSPVRKKDKN